MTTLLHLQLAADEKKSAGVSDWGGYLLWVGIFAVLILGVYALMWRAWKKRGARQAALPAPATVPAGAPADPGTPLLPELSGRYFGSTTAGQWLDRIVAHGLGTRSAADLTLTEKGLRVDRPAAAGFYIPAADLVGARFEKAVAGKVLPEGGLLVVTWKLGDTELDSGFRGDHAAEHDAWVDAVNRLVAGDVPTPTGTNKEGTAQ
ncbi:hypothetical protein [Yinghuangia seranimata]|uniref:PH-like domain-containing protein n=1 Tax=Yinghuangia seranimata TaxID=408067 RepID=UPI00248B21D4|nr:hypothetical protein [Yinghuangia seranimata]MDI2126427.1 hypothetical protein [Yinghuangia seranimata]